MAGTWRMRTLVAGALALPSELVRRTSGAGLRPPRAATAAGGACRSGCCAHRCTAPATVMQREWPSTTTSRAPSSCAQRPPVSIWLALHAQGSVVYDKTAFGSTGCGRQAGYCVLARVPWC